MDRVNFHQVYPIARWNGTMPCTSLQVLTDSAKSCPNNFLNIRLRLFGVIVGQHQNIPE